MADNAKRKALVVAGGWSGHEPKKCAHIIVDLLRKEDFEVELTGSMDAYEDAEKMSGLSLVVPIWTMGEISGEQAKGLLEAVQSGVGIAGFHGGMADSFRQNCGYQFMVGGQFVAHPGGIKDYDVYILKPHDPVVEGLANFHIKSEQYYMHVDPSNDVLAGTLVEGGETAPWIQGCEMPVVWKRMYGKGRVFYSSLGHVAADFDIPEVKEIQRRGMLWAAR